MAEPSSRKAAILATPGRETAASPDVVPEACRREPALGVAAAGDAAPAQGAATALAAVSADRVGRFLRPYGPILDGAVDRPDGRGGRGSIESGGPPAMARARAERRRT